MKKVMTKIVHDIALSVGGSHYPEVGGELLQKFTVEVIKECAMVIRNLPNEYALEFDRENCAKAIEDHFQIHKLHVNQL